MSRAQGLSALVSRLVLAACFGYDGLAHFGAFGGRGIGGFADFLGGHGVALPELTAWVVAIGEIASGTALLLGCFHRLATAALLVGLAGAMWFVYRGQYFGAGGGEYAVALMALALSVWAHGPGPFAYRIQVRKERPPG
jgi:putative oxidoreductase